MSPRDRAKLTLLAFTLGIAACLALLYSALYIAS